MANKLTTEQIFTLIDAGYAIEDMGHEYGPDFMGQYRWLNGDDFQDGEASYSAEDAVLAAYEHMTSQEAK